MVSPKNFTSRFDLEQLKAQVINFQAGNISSKYRYWRRLTSDSHILNIVRDGLKLEFSSDPPEREPFEYPRGKAEYDTIDNEISQLLKKGVIEYCDGEDGEYFSNLFTTSKKDGTYSL